MSKIGAIIVARMKSKRLPGKVLMKIGGKSILRHIVERLKKAGIEKIVIARPSSAPYREEWDVLGRVVDVAEKHGIEDIVLARGDNPMLDVELLRGLLNLWEVNSFNYASYKSGGKHAMQTKHGIYTEIVTKKRLRYRDVGNPLREEMEHITIKLYDECIYHPWVVPKINLSIDTQKDLDRVRKWYANQKYKDS